MNSIGHNLTFKITSKVVLIISLIMAILCVIISISLTNVITTMSEEKIENLAEQNASITTDYLNVLEEKASSLASVVSTYSSLDESTSKQLTKDFFTSALQDKRIFGIYLALEPNKYYQNTSGGYSFYAYNSGNGIVYENYGYADYKDIEAYAIPKSTKSAHITEPYSWTLTNGDVVWLISISVPLYDSHDNFIGVTTCDVSTDTINNLEFKMGNYKTSYSYILTGQGNYVVHSTDDAKSGTAYAESGMTEAVLNVSANGERKLFNDENQVYGGQAYKIHVPLTINGVDDVWSSAFVVNKSEVLSSVNYIIKVVVGTCACGIVLLVVFTALLLRYSLKPIKGLVLIATDMNNGKLSSNISINTKDELGNLSQIFNSTAQTLNGYIKEISEILEEISRGNLTVAVKRNYEGDFEPIKTALTSILASLNMVFNEIGLVGEQVSAGSSQVASGAQLLASGATEQASTLEELYASISQVSSDVQRNATNVNLASDYISQAGAGVAKSNEHMGALLSAMQGINQSSTQISGIIKVIDDISFQTNILALNAAVEAARAGAAGKGFAVVAEEVRNLASKSANAAKQTSELITYTIAAIENGTKLAESTASALAMVEEKAALVETTNSQIKEASNAQALAISEIQKGLEQVSIVTQTISATSEENAAASEELSAHSQNLYDQVVKFKTL